MPSNRPHAFRRPLRGLSLVESLCVASIVATSVGLAVPSLGRWQEHQALQAASAEFETNVQYARSHAIASNRIVRLSVAHTAGGSCYALHLGDPEECTCEAGGKGTCSDPSLVLRQVDFTAGGPVKLAGKQVSLAFTPQHGTVTPTATFRFESRSGTAIHQVVNIMGRTRSCLAAGELGGLKAC